MPKGGTPSSLVLDQMAGSLPSRRTSEAQVLALGSCSRMTKIVERVFHRAPEAEPGVERNIAHGLGRNIAQVEGDQAKAAALDKQISGAEGLVDIAAAHPKQLLEFHASGCSGVRIESVMAVDQGTDFFVRGSFGQGGNQEAGAPGARRAADFGEAATRETARERVDFRDAHGNCVHDLAVAIGKGRDDASGESRFDLRPYNGEVCSHGEPEGEEDPDIFRFFFAYG